MKFLDFVVGIDYCFRGLRIFQIVKNDVGVPVLTNAHKDMPLGEVVLVVGMMQTPTLLVHQD